MYVIPLHFQEKLFPTIHLFWKSYQENVLDKLKSLATPLVIAGDARHDSMGHSAKYGAYTVFSCCLPLIITFSLVQVRWQYYYFSEQQIHVDMCEIK